MSGAKYARCTAQVPRPYIKTTAKSYEKTHAGKDGAVLQDPFLLRGKSKTDQHDLGAALPDLSDDLRPLLRVGKITVMAARDDQRGKTVLPTRSGLLCHARLAPEKIDGISKLGGEVQYHLARFNAGQAVTQRTISVQTGSEQQTRPVGQEEIGLAEKGVKVRACESIRRDLGVGGKDCRTAAKAQTRVEQIV